MARVCDAEAVQNNEETFEVGCKVSITRSKVIDDDEDCSDKMSTKIDEVKESGGEATASAQVLVSSEKEVSCEKETIASNHKTMKLKPSASILF